MEFARELVCLRPAPGRLKLKGITTHVYIKGINMKYSVLYIFSLILYTTTLFGQSTTESSNYPIDFDMDFNMDFNEEASSAPIGNELYEEPCFDCAPCNPCCMSCCDGWVYVDHVEGHWLDNREGYTSLGLFVPVPISKTPRFLPFLDLRGHWFNDGKAAANLGGGLRLINYNTSRVFGVNAFYDYRKVSWNNEVHQIGIGFEALSPCWDFRFNGYFPLGERSFHSRRHHFEFTEGDGFMASCRESRNSMAGFDAEVGRWLNRCNCFNLYGAIGFYSYFPNKNKRNLYGGQARLLADIGRYVSLEVRGGYDQVSHGMVQGRITITIPFDTISRWAGNNCSNRNCQNCCCFDVACQPIYRQEIIALSGKDCCWEWNWCDSESR